MHMNSNLIRNLSKFRLITFDVTDTLLKLNHKPAIQYSKTALDYGYQIDAIKLNANFYIEFKEMQKLHPNFGRTTNLEWRKWWQILLKNIFEKSTNVNTLPPRHHLEQIINQLIQQYRTNECWTKIDYADQLITTIRQIPGIKIGIISNFDPSLHWIIRNLNLPKFDLILTSYEQNSLKPNLKIFNQALKMSNCQSHEALHIGNTFELDYVGAKNAGWSSLLICNQLNLVQNQFINPNHVFQDLEHLFDTLVNGKILW